MLKQLQNGKSQNSRSIGERHDPSHIHHQPLAALAAGRAAVLGHRDMGVREVSEMKPFEAETELHATLDLDNRYGPGVKVWQPYYVEGESSLSLDQAKELRDWLNIAIDKIVDENLRRANKLEFKS